MPVVGTEIAATTPDTEVDLCLTTYPVYTPEVDYHEGCPVLSKVKHVVIPKGVAATIQWTLRRPDGSTHDLSYCFPPDPDGDGSLTASLPPTGEKEIRVRFYGCDVIETPIWEVNGIVADAVQGVVEFNVPSQVYSYAGIYRMDIAVVDVATEIPAFIENGLLSVEGSAWGDTTQTTSPPTLNDIRMHLRDTPIENTLTDEAEYSGAEIVSALLTPIRQWNELPPPVARFCCANFPYQYHWRQAVVGELMRTAAHHYMRNNFNASHGGVSGNFKDKYKEYMAFAESYRQEWIEFCREKKVALNLQGGFSTISSPYSGRL